MAVALVAVISLSLLPSVFTATALEKTAKRADDRPELWSQATTCTVAYYNTCTGWIWCWSGYSPFDMVGVCVQEPCCTTTPVILQTSWHYLCTGTPVGWGFTGTLDIFNADPQCAPTGPPLFSSVWLPASGWNSFGWGVPVPFPYVMAVTWGPGPANPSAIATDHPAAGPTGPQACGYCYPSPRTTFSFYYGTPTSPLTPGSPLDDGICYAELFWDFAFTCGIGVEESTWGAIKGLYH
jgi:hypothetical protein